MSLNAEIQVLREIPFFAEIEDSKLKLIVFASQRLHFAPNEAIFEQGDPTDSIYIIIEGEADVVMRGANGERMTMATIGKNGIFGEIGVLCNMPRSATIVAKTELAAMKIERTLFRQLLVDFPEIALAVMHELSSRILRSDKFIAQVPSEQAKAIFRRINEG